MRKLWFVLAFISVLPSAIARQEESTARFSKAFEAIDRAAAASPSPGFVIAITGRNRTLKVVAHGYADLKTKTPLTPESLFEIGSISKSFTAIALMQLFDEGRFDPQAPISKYLPWFEIKSRYGPIKGHHLLTHTAGLQNYRADLASMPFAAYSLRDFESSYAPGEHFWYSNTGYQTLGDVLERIDGAAYDTIIQRRVLSRVGMSSTAAVIDDKLRAKLPVSYTLWPYTIEYLEQPWFEYRAADGSIASTAADMAAYARLILNRGATPQGRVLSERAFEKLTTPFLNNYAYGLTVRQQDGDTVIGHNGGIAGFASFLEVHMNDGYAVIVLSNGGNEGGLAPWISNTLRATIRNQPLPDLPQRQSADRVADAADYAGLYRASDVKTAEFVAIGGGLSLKLGDSMVSLRRVGRDSFRASTPELVFFPFAFVRDNGKVVEVSHGPEWYTNQAYTGPKRFDTPPDYLAYAGRYQNHNPEMQVIRIFMRKGRLMFATGMSDGQPLVSTGPGQFRPANPDYNPERYHFDSIVEGRALRVIASGMPMYRVDAP